jgi:hypothetical protein
MHPLPQPRRARSVAWLRLKETPLELTIGLLAAVVSVLSLVYEPLTWITALVYVVLALGGVVATAGRFADDPDVESAGLAFLIAGLGFLFLRQLPQALTLGVEAVLGLVFNFGALAVGFGIRLHVVRVAARARRRAARIVGRGNRGGQ